MAHHHKSNERVEESTGQVEKDSDNRHGRGMPRRPDEGELERRTEEDRLDVGLPADAPEAPAKQGEDVEAEVDQQVERGEMPTGTASKKERDPFPPTNYES
ncbi:hypothetical protein ACGFSB_21860 [Streptomyces sp. NPDC048441]|uniref:hypothetical protein n=1 Tax=Streptomyces sp. NPDC048441 TaxID=3365552 RepID=UPI003715C47A